MGCWGRGFLGGGRLGGDVVTRACGDHGAAQSDPFLKHVHMRAGTLGLETSHTVAFRTWVIVSSNVKR